MMIKGNTKRCYSCREAKKKADLIMAKKQKLLNKLTMEDMRREIAKREEMAKHHPELCPDCGFQMMGKTYCNHKESKNISHWGERQLNPIDL